MMGKEAAHPEWDVTVPPVNISRSRLSCGFLPAASESESRDASLRSPILHNRREQQTRDERQEDQTEQDEVRRARDVDALAEPAFHPADVLDGDGTFHTGDLGRIDDDGFVWILGRVKEQYKLENGKYVVPAPVEEQLKLSPYIDQIMIEGTGCPYNVAVIVVDGESLREFADAEGIDYESTEDLLDEPRIRKLYADELDTWGEEVKSYELPEDFVLTAEGFSSREIGEKLFISPKTVDTYRSRIMKKLELNHRSELVRFALKVGLLKEV